MRCLSGILAIMMGSTLAAQDVANAQDAAAWPQRPVTVVVPFGAGGSADLTARIVAPHLQAVFGQPGASNALATKLNDLTGAAQTLSTSPDSSSARFGVLTAIKLEGQRCFEAKEVENIGPVRNLPVEFPTVDLPVSDASP